MTTPFDRWDMVGKGRACPGCGAPLRKGYEYCNACGRKVSEAPGTRRTVPVSPPRLLPEKGKRREVPKSSENPVPRRELTIALLAMTCMAPFCTWLSSFGGVIGISAAFNEAFYGRYVVLLAAIGLLTIVAGNLVPAAISRKAIIAGVGVGTLALTALDYVEIMRYNLDIGPFYVTAMPGIGMYLAFALGTALTLAVMIPKRKRSPLGSEGPVLRIGSRGSDPSARR